MPYVPLPPPPAPQGITQSAPLNVAAGLGATFATNSFSAAQSGPDTVGLGYVTTMAFQFAKQFEWFDQHRWWPLALLLIGLLLALVVTHFKLEDALPKAGNIAWQAMMNYAGMKGTGLGGVSPSTVYPGSQE